MNLTNLQVLLNQDGELIDLLPHRVECKHRIEAINLQENVRLASGDMYLAQKGKVKRRLTIDGVGHVPDMWHIPYNSVLTVKSGSRFYSKLPSLPEYAVPGSAVKYKSFLSYRIVMSMVTTQFRVFYNELDREFAWEWQLEEV